MIFPALDEMAAQFPKVEFKNNQILSEFDKAVVLKHKTFCVVIDPKNSFKSDLFFPGLWLLFTKNALNFYYQSEHIQTFFYSDPVLIAFFSHLAGFKNGSGILEGEFFLKIKQFFKESFYSYGFFYFLLFLFFSLFFNFLFSFFGHIFSKLIVTSLTWKQIRNISFYAFTPVLLFMVACSVFNLGISSLWPVLFLVYALFMGGAIYRFKIADKDEEDFF